MAFSDWSGRLGAIGASANEVSAISGSYQASATPVQEALDALIAAMSSAELLVMLSNWRANPGPFQLGFPGGGLPFGTGVAILTGDPGDDGYAIAAGTGRKVATLFPAEIPTLDLIPAPAAPVSLNSKKLTNLADAAAGTDALNRETGDGRYVHQDGTGLPVSVDFVGSSGGAYSATAGQVKVIRSDGTTGYVDAPTVYAKAWGVKGDGTSADDANLQSAVNQAGTLNGTCEVGQGSYRLTAGIAIPDNTHLKLDPRTILIRDHATTGTTGGTLYNQNQTNGTGIRITGGILTTKTSASTGYQIAIVNASDVKIIGTDVASSYGQWTGILKNVNDFTVSGGHWTASGTLGNDGLHVYGGQKGEIVGMRIIGADDALSIGVQDAANTNVQAVNVTGCVLQSQLACPIKIHCDAPATTSVSGINITNCSLIANGTHAVGIGDSTTAGGNIFDVTVAHCWAYVNATGAPVLFSAGANNLTFDDIKVYCTSSSVPNSYICQITHGTGTANSCTNVTVNSIKLMTPSGSGLIGIRVDFCDTFWITNCAVANQSQFGILLGSAGAVTHGTVTGNDVSSSVSGIRLVNASHTRVALNTARDCSTASISEVSPSSANTILGNDITGSPAISTTSSSTLVGYNQGNPASDPYADSTYYLGSAVYRQTADPRYAGGNFTGPGSGVMLLTGVRLMAGDMVNKITVLSGSTPLTMGTNADGHLWFALYDPSGNLLATTADQGGSATWAANTALGISLTSPYSVTASGWYYVAVMVNVGTGGAPAIPSYRGYASSANATAQAGWASGRKILTGSAGSGLTTPAGAPNPATITATANGLLAEVS